MQVEKDGNPCDLRVKICVASVSWITCSVFSSALRTSTESTAIPWNMSMFYRQKWWCSHIQNIWISVIPSSSPKFLTWPWWIGPIDGDQAIISYFEWLRHLCDLQGKPVSFLSITTTVLDESSFSLGKGCLGFLGCCSCQISPDFVPREAQEMQRFFVTLFHQESWN